MTGVEERYIRATGSTHLEWREHTSGPLDLLVAAGIVSRHSLGTMLFRLCGEYDTVAQDVRRAGNQPTEMLLILSRLRSLPVTRDAIGSYAHTAAERYGLDPAKDTQAIRAVCSAVLQHLLAPRCWPCEGRGKIGEYGGVMTICPACKGTGKRPESYGRDERCARLGIWLRDELDRKAGDVARKMAAYDRALLAAKQA